MTRKTNRKSRLTLLASVSAVAIFIGAEAQAADLAGVAPNSNEWWLSVEGQYLLFGGDDSFGGPELDDGWGGAVELGMQPAGSDYSFVTRVRYGEGDGNNNGGYGGYGSNFNTSDEEHLIADIEIGRDVGIGGADVRVHAGLRFAYMNDETSYYYGYGQSDSDFVGVGPRVGFDASVPVAGNLNAEVKAAGAVLFGKRDSEVTVGGYYTTSLDDNVVVPNLEGSVGLNYLFGENMSAALGYRADMYWNVVEKGGSDGDRLIHGPYARFTVKFGGN